MVRLEIDVQLQHQRGRLVAYVCQPDGGIKTKPWLSAGGVGVVTVYPTVATFCF